jgi:hypothetical protein
MPEGIARICNDATRAKTRFYVAMRVRHHTRYGSYRFPVFSASRQRLTVLAQRAIRANMPLRGLARSACVVCDGRGHKPKQRWWEIMTHSLDDEQLGSFDMGRRVLSSFRGNQGVV